MELQCQQLAKSHIVRRIDDVSSPSPCLLPSGERRGASREEERAEKRSEQSGHKVMLVLQTARGEKRM